MTYAKLSQLAREELEVLRPDALVLDEMHRAAAATWELPVQTLLAHKPEPFVIGLTATHIRYLDGQKDTTAVFHMNIASEMLLEKLRRALEQADGLDVVFRKHMTDTTGKYLVFCANVEHMRAGAAMVCRARRSEYPSAV